MEQQASGAALLRSVSLRVCPDAKERPRVMGRFEISKAPGRPLSNGTSRMAGQLGLQRHKIAVVVAWALRRTRLTFGGQLTGGSSDVQRTPSNRGSLPEPCQSRSSIDLAGDELTGYAYGLTTLKVPPKASIPLPLPAVPVVIGPIAPTNGCSWL